MKTILYNPIFINPQAYYVFPRLTRYLQPDNESTSEPANYIGTIEVKVIAYGDTTLKRTYTNTDSIDLSEFKNTWIRISLFTKVGSCVLGEWKIGNMESDLPYIDPEVLASLKAVVIVGNKTNNDSDRAIVKNLVDASNPFIISNAAFKLNSGFGEYKEDFTSWRIYPNIKVTDNVITTNGNFNSTWFIYKHSSESKINEMNIKVSGIPKGGKILYFYISDETANLPIAYTIPKDGIYHLPESKINNNRVSVGFTVESRYDWNNIRIEQIPSFEGAFVTDGVNDLITSAKTVQEMLGGSNEITVVSMIHQIGLNCRTNFICDKGSYWRCNEVANTGEGKTGIYGYSSTNLSVNTSNIINNVLGDKVDYSVTGDRNDLTPSQFSVVGYTSSNGGIAYISSIAWYWTIIANKVLTTDQINQVIAYFNLDRTLKPDILCDVKKQGITNENHAEFGDKLIDFSGNGRDIQLNNLAWKGDSGIGKYNFSNIKIIASNRFEGAVTTNKCHFTKKLTNTTNNFCDLIVISPNEPIKFKVSGLSDGRKLFVANKSGSGSNYNFDNGEHEVSLSFSEGVGQNNPFGVTGDIGDIDVTVEFIPSHAGGLCLDGVNDFGKVTGLPIYKDYTVIADYIRTFAKENVQDAPILSKSKEGGDGAFIFNYVDYSTSKTLAYSFANINNVSYINDFERNIYYQSKYTNNGNSINAGTGVDTNSMWLGTYRDNVQNYFTGAIYSLMSFPYSMSEFLIERQLKKHKLGTLYPDMVEFRPIVKSNLPYSSISYSVNPGEYISVDSMVTITVTLPNTSDKLMEVSCNAISDISISGDNGVYEITGKIVKSPQKINMIISSYLTMLNNETLISNETLIKNE